MTRSADEHRRRPPAVSLLRDAVAGSRAYRRCYGLARQFDARRPVHLLVATALATVIGLGTWSTVQVASIAWCFADLDDCTTSQPDMGRVREIAELRLPRNAHLRYSFYSAWMEWNLYAIVDFPSQETDRFLADNGLPAPTDGLRAVPDGWTFNDDGDTQPEWHPERVASYADVSACTPTRCRDLMLDRDDPAVTVLYISVLSDEQPRSTRPS